MAFVPFKKIQINNVLLQTMTQIVSAVQTLGDIKTVLNTFFVWLFTDLALTKEMLDAGVHNSTTTIVTTFTEYMLRSTVWFLIC